MSSCGSLCIMNRKRGIVLFYSTWKVLKALECKHGVHVQDVHLALLVVPKRTIKGFACWADAEPNDDACKVTFMDVILGFFQKCIKQWTIHWSLHSFRSIMSHRGSYWGSSFLRSQCDRPTRVAKTVFNYRLTDRRLVAVLSLFNPYSFGASFQGWP